MIGHRLHITRPKEDGFTLVELMIATIVFTVVLLGTSTALIQIGKMYYKGVITSRTQETARHVIDDISRQIQFGGDNVQGPFTQNYPGTPAITVSAYCVGNQRFSFILGPRVSDTVASGAYNASTQDIRHVLWRDTLSSAESCTPLDLRYDVPQEPAPANTPHPGSELLGQNMRLKALSVTPEATDNKLFTVHVDIIYGDPDLITFAPSVPPGNPDVPQGCQGLTTAGSQWCAESGLTTTVIKRLR